jgi:glycosyltransferase involved in cell wall biosynthesis
MKVSVQIITYNHEKYITQAVESVLMQEVNFDYEIVIGEDCSTDGTREIVVAYQKKYPDRIRALLPEKNLGGMRNVIESFNTCSGEYIAALEGDDYWTSPHKLQKQVDYLDNHPECVLCFHNAFHFYEDGSRESFNYNSADQKEISTLEDLWERDFITTCSAMFRKSAIGHLGDWFLDFSSGDWATWILAARHGNIGYINEVMCAHRIHSTGMWGPLKRMERLQGLVKFYRSVDDHLEFANHKKLRLQIAQQYYYLSEEYEKQGDARNARKYAVKCILERYRAKHIPGRDLFKRALRLYAPGSYRVIADVRKSLRP